MKVITYETLYHEDHGATLKHKCGKRIVALSLLSFSLIFYLALLSVFASFFSSGVSSRLVGESWSPSSFPHLGQCSNNDDHHTLFTYNSRITTQYLELNMTLCEFLRRCTGICNESRVTCMKELWMVTLPQIRCQLHDHAKQYDNDGLPQIALGPHE